MPETHTLDRKRKMANLSRKPWVLEAMTKGYEELRHDSKTHW